MPRTLLLLRTAKSEPPDATGQRPLKDKGKRGAQKMGIWLAENGLLPARTLCAPQSHAIVTAEKLLKAAGRTTRQITPSAQAQSRDLADLLTLLSDPPQGNAPLLCVGPKTSLLTLTRHLTGQPLKQPRLRAGALIHLRLPDRDAASAELVQIIQPQDLPTGFPYPGTTYPSPNTTERRPRPAYYYTQSAVLPFRQGANGLEILLIRSSKGTHWVIPKGIHEPGLSATQSAAKEAEEEAGIKGHVTPTAIASFQQEKWGATCTISVYPMQVTTELHGAHWPESHRTRRWMPADQAAPLLASNPALAALVAEFCARQSAS